MTDKISKIDQILSEIPSKLENGSTQGVLVQSFIDVLGALGYSGDEIYVDVQIKVPENIKDNYYVDNNVLTFDVIVAESISSQPYISCSVSTSTEGYFDNRTLVPESHLRLSEAVGTVKSEYTILLTEKFISIQDGYMPVDYELEYTDYASNYTVFPFKYINKNAVKQIIDYLQRPEELPAGSSLQFPPGYHPDQTKLTRWLFSDSDITPEYKEQTETDYFSLDIDRFSELLYQSYISEDSNKKGESLEETLSFLFDSLLMLEVRDENLRTKTAEFDIILEYSGFGEYNLFEYYDRFIPVESKNTKNPIRAKEVRNFSDKVSRTYLDLGIFVSWNGITGEGSRDAEGIVKEYDENSPIIIVLNSRDLYRILDGECLYNMIDEKLYTTRFNV
jgi:hypothetical protein